MQLVQLRSWAKKLAVDGVDLVAISADPPEDAKRMADKLGIEYPVLSDPYAQVIDAYGVRMRDMDIAVPTTFVLDGEGRVVWRRQSDTQFDRPSLQSMKKAVVRARR